MRVIVTGGRSYPHSNRVYTELATLAQQHGELHILVGDCPSGADHHARKWHEAMKSDRVTLKEYIAHWSLYGNAAGPMRNGEMVRAGADLVLAFAGGKGTQDCMTQARRAGIPIKEVA